MTVKEYLFGANISEEELANILGYKTTAPITKRLDEELPKRWADKLEVASEESETPAIDNHKNGETTISDDDLQSWVSGEGRDEDKDPDLNQTKSSGVE